MGLTRILYRLCRAFFALLVAAFAVYIGFEATNIVYSFHSFCSKNVAPAYIHRLNGRVFLMLTCHRDVTMNISVEKKPQGKRL